MLAISQLWLNGCMHHSNGFLDHFFWDVALFYAIIAQKSVLDFLKNSLTWLAKKNSLQYT